MPSKPHPLRLLAALVAIGVLASFAASAAADTQITPPAGPIAPGKLVQLPITGLEPSQADGATFLCFPEATAIPATWGRTSFVMFSADKPGKYELLLVVPQDGPDQIVRAAVAVEGDSPNPPGPGPGPQPPGPGPNPQPGAKWVILIEESSQRSPALGRLIADPSLRAYLREAGHTWCLRDQDSVPPDLVPYRDRARAKGLPCLMVVTAEGKTLWEGAPPASAEDLVTLLKQLGG